MDKLVVYAGTRNVYEQMYVSLKSLLVNTPVNGVMLLIEDDEFPYPLPKCVVSQNVSKQEFFLPGSPNFNTPWSYMELLRCALGKMLPDFIKNILWLDVDTIVDGDISELFEMNLNGYYYAGVMEPKKSNMFFKYINTGVLLYNLSLLRMLKKEDELIGFLNTYHFTWPGQDVINLLCQGRIKTIDSEFNASAFTPLCNRPKIIHFAAMKPEDYKKHPLYKKYEALNFKFEEDGGEQ